MGASGAPWFVNPIKGQLPLLEGDGRVSSSDDLPFQPSLEYESQAPLPESQSCLGGGGRGGLREGRLCEHLVHLPSLLLVLLA